MKLSEAIKNNPYLKAVNCSDIDDINCGIKAVFELERVFGRKKVLDNLFEKLHDKKEKMKNEKK